LRARNTSAESALKGRVFDIQRMSIHDGPGIRTTVFLKGCALRCAWCHNPEGLDPNPQLSFAPALCIGCGDCARVCPNGAHLTVDGVHQLDRSRCKLCFACVEACCSTALEIVGKEMTVDEVLAEVIRDKPFYDESGGGMTVSGGEPLAQFEFTKNLLIAARVRGLHTCLETSGFNSCVDVTALVPLVDLFLFDVKETDPERHRAFTGQSNAAILDNLRRLDAAGAAIVLRCVIIPEVNLRDSHLEAVAELARSLRKGRGVEIMGYHRLGEGKRQRLGIIREDGSGSGFTEMTREQLESAAGRLRALGCEPVTAF